MAGHSKWANIQHRKSKQDAKKGKIFTKMIREITVAARQGGGGDPNSNSRLRLAVDRALGSNMTRDTIDRAIKRGIGEDADVALEEIRYEGYAAGGVAVIIDCLSDNRNRTVAEVRHAFSKHGGNLGATGSVSYLFKQRGVLCFPPGSNEDKIMQIALDAGADDVVANSDGSVDVFTTQEDFPKVKMAMEKAGLQPGNAEVTWIASTECEVDNETAEKVTNLIDVLEDMDDVQNVYTNVKEL
ncbi:MAG: YebC/PmpR family DNA-binding transcriptional regulator [Gammaproteobacteria bacterium]